MSRIKIADLKQSTPKLRILEEQETARIMGGSDLSGSTYNLSDAGGEQKIAIVTQSLSNINKQFGFANSYFEGDINANYNSQSNTATAD